METSMIQRRSGKARGLLLACLASLFLHVLLILGLVSWPCRSPPPARSTHLAESAFWQQSGGDPFLASSESTRVEPPAMILHYPLTSADGAIQQTSGFAQEYSAQPTTAKVQTASGPITGNGGGQTTSFFEISTKAMRVVYVIDASASMGRNGAWVRASAELLKSLQQLPASASFQVLLYSSHPRYVHPRLSGWLAARPDTLREIEEGLERENVEGLTNHVAALQRALVQGADVIFFLTDADDLTPEQLRQIKLANRGRAVIHAIEFSRRSQVGADLPLQRLAHTSAGQYRVISLTD